MDLSEWIRRIVIGVVILREVGRRLLPALAAVVVGVAAFALAIQAWIWQPTGLPALSWRLIGFGGLLAVAAYRLRGRVSPLWHERLGLLLLVAAALSLVGVGLEQVRSWSLPSAAGPSLAAGPLPRRLGVLPPAWRGALAGALLLLACDTWLDRPAHPPLEPSA